MAECAGEHPEIIPTEQPQLVEAAKVIGFKRRPLIGYRGGQQDGFDQRLEDVRDLAEMAIRGGPKSYFDCLNDLEKENDKDGRKEH